MLQLTNKAEGSLAVRVNVYRQDCLQYSDLLYLPSWRQFLSRGPFKNRAFHIESSQPTCRFLQQYPEFMDHYDRYGCIN